MDNIIKDCLSALDRLENDALNSRDGYGYSGGDAETIRRAISENESLRRENEELKAKLDNAKWQPIETAPKDGTDIYATRVDGVVFRPSVIYFEKYENRGWLCSQTHKAVNSQPTHWMPIPQPPTMQGEPNHDK